MGYGTKITAGNCIPQDSPGRSATRIRSRVISRLYAARDGADPLARALYVDVRTSLPDSLLAVAERSALAAGLRLRFPFLDCELVEFAAAIPSRHKQHGVTVMRALHELLVPPAATPTHAGSASAPGPASPGCAAPLPAMVPRYCSRPGSTDAASSRGWRCAGSGTTTAPAVTTMRGNCGPCSCWSSGSGNASTGTRRANRSNTPCLRARLTCVGLRESSAADRLHRTSAARAVLMRDVLTHRGPDGAGPVRRRPRRPRAPPSEHRRSRRRPSAAVERRRHDLGHLQRRDLQPRRRPAASSKRPGTGTARGPTPKPSSTPTSSGATTACTASAACSRSRSGTRRGGGCCWCATGWASSRCTGRSARRRGDAAVRVRDQGDPRERPGRGAAEQPRCCPEVLATRYTSGDRDDVRGHLQAAARPSAGLRARARRRSSRYWDLPLDGPDPELERRRRRELIDRFRDAARRSRSGCG